MTNIMNNPASILFSFYILSLGNNAYSFGVISLFGNYAVIYGKWATLMNFSAKRFFRFFILRSSDLDPVWIRRREFYSHTYPNLIKTINDR